MLEQFQYPLEGLTQNGTGKKVIIGLSLLTLISIGIYHFAKYQKKINKESATQ
jgi:hypothetical protein